MKTSHRRVVVADLILRFHGKVPWEAWMAAALYDPRVGFYTGEDRVLGPRGHFTTIPERGELLAEAVARTLRRGNERAFVELGAGTGAFHLALAKRLDPLLFFPKWRRTLMEISPTLREMQRKTLGWRSRSTEWAGTIQDVFKNSKSSAFLFGNEFVDAFPCVRLRRDSDAWQEWHLCFEENGAWKSAWLPASERALASLALHPGVEEMPRGSILESSPAFTEWLRELAGIWKNGRLLLIDYGYEPAEDRRALCGTLRGYHLHQRVTDEAGLVRNFGRQDLTFDVDFGWLAAVAADVGLCAKASCTLGKWLLSLGLKAGSAEEERFFDLSDAGGAFRVIEIHKPIPRVKD